MGKYHDLKRTGLIKRHQGSGGSGSLYEILRIPTLSLGRMIHPSITATCWLVVLNKQFFAQRLVAIIVPAESDIRINYPSSSKMCQNHSYVHLGEIFGSSIS